MARGRRPDNSLEPSRQLLTQRAFRQRRAAHLAELEAKVRKLERENASLKGVAYVEEEETGKNSKRPKTERSVSGERPALAEEMEADEEEDESELICERCAGYERDRLETLNAVSAVDNCLSQLSESMHNLRRDLTKHTEAPLAIRRETLGSISPLQTSHLNMPMYQAHSSQTSPLSDTTASHSHQQLFLEVPGGSRQYHDLHDPSSATSMTSVASTRFKSPTSPLSPFQAMNISESTSRPQAARKKSHTRVSNSVDESQSSKAQSMTGAPMHHHRSAASVSSLGSTPGQSLTPSTSLPSTCTPRGGGCCSKSDTPADHILERAKQSMMPQAREGKNLEMSAGTRRLLQQQQQQHLQLAQQHSQQVSNQINQHMKQATFLTQHPQQHQASLLPNLPHQQYSQSQSFLEQLHSPSSLPSPLPAETNISASHALNVPASDFPQIHLDESKCCLGIFECDTQGNILCGNR